MSGTELLQIADAVAREKTISRESVLTAMEQGIQGISRKKYGHELDIQAHIDRKTGEIVITRIRQVVADDAVEDAHLQIGLTEALAKEPEMELGGTISDPLPPFEKSWISAQQAKQIIRGEVAKALRQREYEDFKDRVGELINGVVEEPMEFGNVKVNLGGRAEGILHRNALIPGDKFVQGQSIRAYIEDVRRENKGAQIFLSRSHNMFLAKLFTQEVPEIYDGVIEIMAVAREPGSRAKIAVTSHDSNIDPVGSCVGVRGSRVQAVIAELQGEKIDIVPWSSDPATFVIRALAPAEVNKVVIDEIKHRIEVVVAPEQQSLAIGRRGQNVRLASQLTGWRIDVLTDEEEARRRQDEFQQACQLFMQALDVDEDLATLLVTEGFTNVRDFIDLPAEEIGKIEGFSLDLAEALRERAEQYLAHHTSLTDAEMKQLHLESGIASLPGMTDPLMIQLSENDLDTVLKIADLAADEFEEMLPNSGLTHEEINALIMAARAIAYQ